MSDERKAITQDLEHAAWAAFVKDMPDVVRAYATSKLCRMIWQIGYYRGLQDGHAHCHEKTEAAIQKFGDELEKFFNGEGK